MSIGRKKSVDSIIIVPEEEVSVQPPIGFHVTDDGLNGGSSLQLSPHGGRKPLAASGDHHRAGSAVVVTAVAFVGVDALRLDAADRDSLIDRRLKGVAVRPS